MLKTVLSSILIVFMAACTTSSSDSGRVGDGTKVVRLSKYGPQKIALRHLDGVNAVRQARGLNKVTLSPQLTSSAALHATDMSNQNRPWHFGSDGSSPYDRVARAGYAGSFTGENVSETFEDDFNTLNVWMNDDLSRSVILDPMASQMGIAYHQDSNGKIWWVQVFGS